jgi:glycosyltransferase involved in cell wall biosynthesis
MENKAPDISIITALLNEEESLSELTEWADKVLNQAGLSYEFIMIDDGSTDDSWKKICELSERYPVKGVRFRRNYGKSAALYCGFEMAAGDVVVTMDADLQDSPDEIPELYKMVMENGFDLVSGWKKKRYDSKLAKNLPSKIYNATAKMVTGIKLHDMNCGLKAYRNEVVKNIEVYGEMHRYIPYLAKVAGFGKIGEKVVIHRARKYGSSKFGINRFINGFLDLISLWFLAKFGKKPMHFFGLAGTLSFILGFITTVIIIAQKIITQYNGLNYRPVTDQPLFYISLVTLIIGMQLFLTGFVAELVTRNSSERNNYKIRDKI